MTHHPLNGRLTRVAGEPRDLSSTQVIVGGMRQGDAAALHERHQPSRGNRLRDGRHRIERVRCGGRAVRDVGPAEAFLPNDLPVLRHGDGE